MRYLLGQWIVARWHGPNGADGCLGWYANYCMSRMWGESESMQMKTEHKKLSSPVTGSKRLTIVSAGLVNGMWGIILSDGSVLDGVEEIIQTKPSYSDGYTITAKIFIPCKSPPITKSV